MAVDAYTDTSTCPVCLHPTSSDDEAFLDNCFHRFCVQCIKRWSQTQHDQSPAGVPPIYACPLCKTAYASYIYDCSDSSYRRQRVTSQLGGLAALDGSSIVLTTAQRRRRSIYFSPTSTASTASGPGSSGGVVAAAACRAPRVEQWVRRELQALLLDSDVELLLQHVLGTVRSLHPAPYSSRPRSNSMTSTKSEQDFVAALTKAAQPYLFENAPRFAVEAYHFVASGKSVQAHDCMVFGLEYVPFEAAAGPRSNMPPAMPQQGAAASEDDSYVPAAGLSNEQSTASDVTPPCSGQRSSDSEGYRELLVGQQQFRTQAGIDTGADRRSSHQSASSSSGADDRSECVAHFEHPAKSGYAGRSHDTKGKRHGQQHRSYTQQGSMSKKRCRNHPDVEDGAARTTGCRHGHEAAKYDPQRMKVRGGQAGGPAPLTDSVKLKHVNQSASCVCVPLDASLAELRMQALQATIKYRT